MLRLSLILKYKSLEKYEEGDPEGSPSLGLVKQGLLSLNGMEIMVSENSFKHNFSINPTVSLFVECETERELDKLFEKLSQGGQVMMPVGDYGFSKKFGWCADRYGLSW